MLLTFLKTGKVAIACVVGTHNVSLETVELKWVNTEWEQVAADRQKLQNIPNF